ncbi:hypothetical protein MAPG_00293 [Magnaporthiopsis poae ATCC 64411]|uniref:Uncharacterized protein n=1 Tax=Magnaporthiopsis poae (strain ATCC 64411 / 73-15) TaxID=644358 RepID=A0A0C4DKL6_MAGP6|nr:hypothetical protein MAPG_00293 [Magnaporthiopsis poae ATCC 64411]
MRYTTFFKFMAVVASAAPVLALPTAAGDIAGVATLEARTISAGLSRLPNTLNPIEAAKNKYHELKDKHEAKKERKRKAKAAKAAGQGDTAGKPAEPAEQAEPAEPANVRRGVDEEADEAAAEMDEEAFDEDAMDEAATLEARSSISAGLSRIPGPEKPYNRVKDWYKRKTGRGRVRRDVDEEADEAAHVEYAFVE